VKTGTTVQSLKYEEFEVQPIPLPPLAEQKRIVAKVDELMGLCDRLETAQRERESHRNRLAAATYHHLNDEADAEALRSHAQFFIGHLPSLTTRPNQVQQLRQAILNLAVSGKLQKGACHPSVRTNLGEVATLQNGYAFKSEWFVRKGVRLLRNANVSHGVIRWDDLAHLPDKQAVEFERFQLGVGDIVLSLDRPFIVTGTKVARIRVVDLPCLLLQRVGRFQIAKDCLSPDYLFLWLHSPHFTGQIDPGRSNGVPHISSKQVEAAEILVPPLAEQHRVVAEVNELMALCSRLQVQLTTAQTESSRLLESVIHRTLEA
jgi:type I restriction enzyme S subunit